MSTPPDDDPFGTAALRAAVLDGWRASAARFREDANSEQDHALGGYRDRLVVELAQNAADAAARAGVPGRLRLSLTADRLTASNTGAPLDTDGVQGLATLRASTKRDDEASVGRFGVGFAAVLALGDEPAVRSIAGGVRFSAARTRALVEAEPALAPELARRGGQVPVLRLPFADAGAPERGFDSTVELPLRDGAAHTLAGALLGSVDAMLLLGLPALREIVVETDAGRRVLRAEPLGSAPGPGAGPGAETEPPREVLVHEETDHATTSTRWLLYQRSGAMTPELWQGRPTEERERSRWSVGWALPVDADGVPRPLPGSVPAVLHGPTPSDEPVSLPAVLVGDFPLDPSRRHVAPGAATDHLAQEAGGRYADLVVDRAHQAGAGALSLVPTGMAAGALDAALHRSVLAALAEQRWLPLADGAGARVAGPDGVALDPAHSGLVGVLAEAHGALLDPAWCQDRQVLARLGVTVQPLADLLDAVADLRRAPSWWHRLYAALDDAVTTGAVDRALLAGLPVLLSDGRVVRSPRGVVLPESAVGPVGAAATTEAVTALAAAAGLRVADPEAAHPLLARAGAQPAHPAGLLELPAVQAAVEQSLDTDEPEPLARAVLALVAVSLDEGEWQGGDLSALALPTEAGDWAAAGDLLLPDSALRAVLDRDDGDDVVDRGWLDRYGADVLRAVGVVDALALLRLTDLTLDPDLFEAELPEEIVEVAGWADDVLDVVGGGDVPPTVPELVVLPQLFEVRDDGWPTVWPMLTRPPLRDALVSPTRVLPAIGPAVDVVAPTAWWLRETPSLGGRRPVDLRRPDAEPALEGLYDVLPASAPAELAADGELLAAIGVRGSLTDLLAEPGGPDELLERLADDRRDVAPLALAALYPALAALPEERWPQPPQRVRVPRGAGTAVVDADTVTVVAAPHHRAVVDGEVLPGTAGLAALLDVASSAEDVGGWAAEGGRTRDVPAEVLAVLPTAAVDYREHDVLEVHGREVDWWVDPDGQVHAATGDGVARGLAWAGGQWGRRWALAAVLAEPGRLAEVLDEDAYGEG